MLLCFHYLSDVDECSFGQSHCSSFATCYNTPGSYKCKCKDGYRGMGHDCKRKFWEKTPGLIFSLATRNRASVFFLFSLPVSLKMYWGGKKAGREGEIGLQAQSLNWNSFLCNSCQSLLDSPCPFIACAQIDLVFWHAARVIRTQRGVVIICDLLWSVSWSHSAYWHRVHHRVRLHFLQQLSGQRVIYSPQLFNQWTGATHVAFHRAKLEPAAYTSPHRPAQRVWAASAQGVTLQYPIHVSHIKVACNLKRQ